jgi:hypothetical protein
MPLRSIFLAMARSGRLKKRAESQAA